MPSHPELSHTRRTQQRPKKHGWGRVRAVSWSRWGNAPEGVHENPRVGNLTDDVAVKENKMRVWIVGVVDGIFGENMNHSIAELLDVGRQGFVCDTNPKRKGFGGGHPHSGKRRPG